MRRRGIIFLLTVLFISMVTPALSAAAPKAEPLDIILKRYSTQRGLTDWEALVLGVNGVPVKPPLFETNYFKRVEREIKAAKGSFRLVTDYARIALVWQSHQKNARDIAGYDFIEKIENFPARGNQGLNASVWSLIALYAEDSEIKDILIDEILAYQGESGGFSFTRPTQTKPDPPADIDMTAMAVTALAPYRNPENENALSHNSNNKIISAIDNALQYLASARAPGGGYENSGVENAESLSWVIIALCSAGIDIDHPDFIYSEKNLTDLLNDYYLEDGYYAHTLGESAKADPIATRQAALALSAVRRAVPHEAMKE